MTRLGEQGREGLPPFLVPGFYPGTKKDHPEKGWPFIIVNSDSSAYWKLSDDSKVAAT